MKNVMLFAVAGLFGLSLTTPANAQFYPPRYVPPARSSFNLSFGYGSGYGLGSGYNYGLGYNYSYANPYARGHYDHVPAGYRWHGDHYDYVPAHTDYHIGGRRYEVVPTPYGSRVAPYPHWHR